jgi:opacity protein-like surface antigen
MLRNLLPVLALLAGISPAMADQTPWGRPYDPMGDSGLGGYSGLRGSLAWTDDVKVSSGGTNIDAAQNMGYGASIFAGTYLQLSDMIGLRLEGEALYKHFTPRGLTLNGAASANQGRTNIVAPMVNLFWDLPVPSFPFRPFIGAGIGAAWVDTDLSNGTTPILTGNTWNLAYQFMAGGSFPLSQGSRLTAMYRMFRVNNVGYTCHVPTVAKCRSDLSSNSVDIGFEMDI